MSTDEDRAIKRQRTLGQSGSGLIDDLRLSSLWGSEDMNPLPPSGIDQDNPIHSHHGMSSDSYLQIPEFTQGTLSGSYLTDPPPVTAHPPFTAFDSSFTGDVYQPDPSALLSAAPHPPSSSSSSAASSSSSSTSSSSAAAVEYLQPADSSSTLLPPSAWDETLLREKSTVLEGIMQQYLEATKFLRTLTRRLKQAPVPLSRDHMEGLASLIQNGMAHVQKCMYDLEQLFNETFLQPQDIQKAINLRRDLEITSLQLKLHQDEFKYLQQLGLGSHPTEIPTVAFLVVAKCPFPKAIKKETKAASRIEDTTVIRLLTAARVSVKEGAEVTANQVPDEPNDNSPPVQLLHGQLDNQGYAYFESLKFSKATRSKITRLVFRAEVEATFDCGSYGVITLGSKMPVTSYLPSPPFIVFSNESQWEPSEAKLIKKSIFDDYTAGNVNFFRMTNFLQIHFMRGTRQDPANTHQYRCLALRDLRYFSTLVLKTKCFPNLRCIQRAEFEVFWNWFGQVFRKIRHTPNLGKLWLSGLISFMARAEAESYLQHVDSGHFLVRFSETVPKGLVITSRQGTHMEHYLVSVKEKAPLKAVDTLLEYLQNHDKYRNVLVMHKGFLSVHAFGDRPSDFQIGTKDSNFSSFYRTPDPGELNDYKRYDR